MTRLTEYLMSIYFFITNKYYLAGDANTILLIALILILLTDFNEYTVLCVSCIIEILYVLLIFKVRGVCSTFLENGAGSEELQKTDLLTDVVILAPHTWQRHSQRHMHSHRKHKHTILNARLFRQTFSQAYTIACEHKIGIHPVLNGNIFPVAV